MQAIQSTTTGPRKTAGFFAEGYAQKYSKSCAAACLFFIARNLGLQKNPTWMQALSEFPALANAYPYPDYDEQGRLTVNYWYESDIYRITNDIGEDVEDLHSAVSASSVPRIAKAAQQLGLEVSVHWHGINHFDDACFVGLSELGIVVERSQPILGENEFEIKLSRWFVNGHHGQMHYYVVGYDGRIMEPLTGFSYASLEEFNNLCAIQLENLGISFILKDKGGVP